MLSHFWILWIPWVIRRSDLIWPGSAGIKSSQTWTCVSRVNGVSHLQRAGLVDSLGSDPWITRGIRKIQKHNNISAMLLHFWILYVFCCGKCCEIQKRDNNGAMLLCFWISRIPRVIRRSDLIWPGSAGIKSSQTWTCVSQVNGVGHPQRARFVDSLHP